MKKDDVGALGAYAHIHLTLFLAKEHMQIEAIVRAISEFSYSSIKFRDVLGLAQDFESRIRYSELIDWLYSENETQYHNHFIVCCETGGISFASVFAQSKKLLLVIIREDGKLPSTDSFRHQTQILHLLI